MDFTKDYKLENRMVQLRPLNENDFDHLVRYARSEPELWEYSLTSAAGDQPMKRYIEKAIAGRLSGTSYPFIVFDKRTNTYAGSTRFYDYSPTHHSTLIGFTWYGKQYQGTGLNPNCKYLLLSFAFDEMGLERVEFRADYNNKRSIAAMKKIGCIEEGVLRSNCASPSGRRDSIVLSILKEEWFGGVKTMLINKCS